VGRGCRGTAKAAALRDVLGCQIVTAWSATLTALSAMAMC